MDDRTALNLIISLPFALLLAIEVGRPLASARNEAALPLLGKCPGVIVIFLHGGDTYGWIGPFMECWVGALILLAIPGSIGVAKLVLNRSRT